MDIEKKFRALETMYDLPRPPYWVPLRQFHQAFQTVLLDTTSGEEKTIIALFSTELTAHAFLQVTHALSEGWETARLPDWGRILGFLGAMPNVKYMCLDLKDIPDPDAPIYALDRVLKPFRDLLSGPVDV